mmetsp:Transcript_13060/g.33726  ORF Transcript_13060/g.33726 Transcript_13060/m.33726 type:complete len:239 (-) Transcript_13060:537-1253(-)
MLHRLLTRLLQRRLEALPVRPAQALHLLHSGVRVVVEPLPELLHLHLVPLVDVPEAVSSSNALLLYCVLALLQQAVAQLAHVVLMLPRNCVQARLCLLAQLLLRLAEIHLVLGHQALNLRLQPLDRQLLHLPGLLLRPALALDLLRGSPRLLLPPQLRRPAVLQGGHRRLVPGLHALHLVGKGGALGRQGVLVGQQPVDEFQVPRNGALAVLLLALQLACGASLRLLHPLRRLRPSLL